MPTPSPTALSLLPPNLPIAGLGAVVVSYEPEQPRLDELLRTLLAEAELVVVVDNSGGQAFLTNEPELREKVHYLPQKGNIGAGAALNIGFTYMQAFHCRYAAIVSPHSRPPPGMLTALYQHHRFLLQQGIPCAAVGPRQRNAHAKKNPLLPLYQQRGWFLHKVPVGRARTPLHEVDALPISGMLVNMHAWKSGIEFNPGLFVDHTDTDWCFRARAEAFHLYVGLSQEMLHAPPKPIEPGPTPLHLYYFYRNTLYLLRQATTPRAWKRRLRWQLIKRLLATTVRNHHRAHNARCTWAGLRDGLFNVLGPCPFTGDGHWPPQTRGPQQRRAPPN